MKVGTSTGIGAFVRERRGRLALTQGELARRVGVSRLWVAQLEKGKPTAQVGLVLRTLRELGVEVELTNRFLSIPAAPPSAPVRPLARMDLDRIIQNTLAPSTALPASSLAKPACVRAPGKSGKSQNSRKL